MTDQLLSLDKRQLCYPSVEKEAHAIIETVRHWKHYLSGRHFKIITDQKSVSVTDAMEVIGSQL